MAVFRENQKAPGMKLRAAKGGSQPPRKRRVVIAPIRIMWAYSAKKNMAKVIAEYSVLNPDTNSDSPSAISKGARLVSAKADTKNIAKAGNRGIKNQTSS